MSKLCNLRFSLTAPIPHAKGKKITEAQARQWMKTKAIRTGDLRYQWKLIRSEACRIGAVSWHGIDHKVLRVERKP